MSKKDVNEEFWEMADNFIHLANKYMDKNAAGTISSAMLYATARFNAFIVASTKDADLSKEKEEAIEYFTGQYKKMFTENIEDYEQKLK